MQLLKILENFVEKMIVERKHLKQQQARIVVKTTAKALLVV